MDFLEKQDAKQTKKIKAKIKPGCFVNMRNEYGDVWHKIDYLFSDACTIYKERQSEIDHKTDYTRFCRIRKVSEKLPKDARSVFLKEGYFSERKGNLKDIPKKYF
jgi:hypothetical protein